MLHQVLKQSKFASGIVITFQVMAFAGMSPGYPDTVCALAQSGHKKFRVHPAGTGDANDPNVGWIFHPTHTCQVGSPIAAPVAQEGNDFGFPIGHFLILLNFAADCWLTVQSLSDGRQHPAPTVQSHIQYQTASLNVKI
jgi:hypothetical protein